MSPNMNRPGSGLMLLSHTLVAVAGVIGVAGDASASARNVLGPLGHWAVLLWSTLFIISGGLAIYSRIRRMYRAETTAVDMTSGAMALWAAIILAGSEPPWGAGWQVGVAFLAMAAFTRAWSVDRRRRLRLGTSLVEETKRQIIQGE